MQVATGSFGYGYGYVTQLRRITTLIIAMGGGSYFLKRVVSKKGGSREPPEPPLAMGLLLHCLDIFQYNVYNVDFITVFTCVSW